MPQLFMGIVHYVFMVAAVVVRMSGIDTMAFAYSFASTLLIAAGLFLFWVFRVVFYWVRTARASARRARVRPARLGLRVRWLVCSPSSLRPGSSDAVAVTRVAARRCPRVCW